MLENLSLAQSLANTVEQEISGQALTEGTRLGTKADLRRRFGVATTTVNEAVRLLENRGLVIAKPGPGGGLFVGSPSHWLELSQFVLGLRHAASAVADAYAVRLALEPLLAEEAARHHSKRDIRDLRRLLVVMESNLEDPEGFLRSNWALHRRICEICQNRFARSLYGSLLGFAESEVEGVAGRETFSAAANLEVHRDLVDAIASGDPAEASHAALRHNAAVPR